MGPNIFDQHLFLLKQVPEKMILSSNHFFGETILVLMLTNASQFMTVSILISNQTLLYETREGEVYRTHIQISLTNSRTNVI